MSNPNEQHPDFLFQLDEFYLDLREDGRNISFLDKQQIEARPYPGLRPFKTSEFQLFNGRDGQAEELINRIKENHFLAVIGSSGTGKSSLIRAGLIPQLLAGYLHEAGTAWDVAICRPGKDPVENLAIALARTKCKSNKKEEILHAWNVAKPLLTRSIYGILDFNEILNAPDKPAAEKSNLLIIVDQFEELFRFNRDDLGQQDIENHFINLLLKASANPDVSIFVIITMRSEFLGDCAKYRGLPEAINEGQYLVPQLSREQLKEVIEDPILIAGKKIAPGLVELLVNEIEESKVKKDLDQLPILQHALMRTYQQAMKEGATEITYEHYLTTGGLKNALSNHAESRYKELEDGSHKESTKQKIAKLIFQALTDASTDQKKGRRPTELKLLYNITSPLRVTEQEINEVINHFRDTETSFIMPPSNTTLYPDLIMDISHESLMRQWGRLKEWVAKEAENGKILLRLSEYQQLNEQDLKDPLEGKELQQMHDWYTAFKPQDAWANRYSSNYKKSFNYLEKSEKLRIKKRNNSVVLSLAALGIIFILFYLFNFYKEGQQKKRIREQQTVTLANLKKNRNLAMDNENKLQALFFTTEILLLETDRKKIDSIKTNSIKTKLLPGYFLKDIFLRTSVVRNTVAANNALSFLVWTNDSTLSELNAETGAVTRSVKYAQEEEYAPTELIAEKETVFFKDFSLHTTAVKDTVLKDSSLYFKLMFANLFDKDAIGLPDFPKIIMKINGAAWSNDKKRILTWGKNSESIWDALNVWDGVGRAAGISLIHEGIYGASISTDKNTILTWGSDSTVRVWKFTSDTSIIHWPAKLFKLKIQMDTGVEMDEDDYTIKIIHPMDYIKRKEEYLLEYRKYMGNKIR